MIFVAIETTTERAMVGCCRVANKGDGVPVIRLINITKLNIMVTE